METWHLRLTAPDTHTQGSSELTSVAGSVHLSFSFPSFDPNATPPQITIQLIQQVRPRATERPSGRQHQLSLFSCFGWMSKSPCCEVPPSAAATGVETIAQYNASHAPDEIRNIPDAGKVRCRFDFSFNIPSNIPSTTKTAVGSVSYTICATLSSPTGEPALQDSRPVKIIRHAVAEPVSHMQKYPGDEVVSRIHIEPRPHGADTKSKSKASYSVLWRAESTIRPGKRASEVTHVVARELRWRVDESIRYISCATAGQMARRPVTVRTLCSGREKGRWSRLKDGGSGGNYLDIPFDIRIPTRVGALDCVNIASYACQRGAARSFDVPSEGGIRAAITIEHRLYVEVITGEDTFHLQTGDLVDRRTRVKSYKTVVPLPVYGFVADTGENSSLPKYEEPYILPPAYENGF
ncbi:hypothetical protein BJY04DRAFT_223055 [Aspergillus karnatakaensis]|uniref:uncharacterized protein n=1 Tax=Aspergillus karnatakaensis TaxID=1810916 RepID=UPI003CCE1AC4